MYLSRWYVLSSLSPSLPPFQFLADIIIMPLHSTLSERGIRNFSSLPRISEGKAFIEGGYLGT